MAHLAKFSGGMEGAKLYAHWAREKDEKGDYVTYSREHGGGHIDRKLTENNFTIGEIHDREWVAERLKNVYQKPNQKKPVETCDIIVTLPQSESKDIENVKQFMQAAYNSLKKQYGNNNNVVGCWVHLDEAQPHMHFAFLPISARDSKQKPEYKEKLSTRAYWPKKNSLQEMHRTLQKDIDAEMGRHIDGINDGKTKEQGGNKTIVELKKESEKEQRRLDYMKLKPEEMEGLDGEYKKPVLGESYYKLTPYQYGRLYEAAEASIQESKANELVKKENIELRNENIRLKKWMNYYLENAEEKAIEKVGSENEKLKEQNSLLTKENSELKIKNTSMNLIKKENFFLKNFLKSTKQEKNYKKYFDSLPNNVKNAPPDSLENYKDWNLMSQARKEDEIKKQEAKLI